VVIKKVFPEHVLRVIRTAANMNQKSKALLAQYLSILDDNYSISQEEAAKFKKEIEADDAGAI
jgi:hypothetical protein